MKGMFKEERVRGLCPWLSGRSLEATVGKGLRNWKRGEMGQKGVCTEPCGNQPGRPKFPVLTWMGIKGVCDEIQAMEQGGEKFMEVNLCVCAYIQTHI